LCRLFLVWPLVLGTYCASHAADSPYALEIIQPRAGLNTENRFYKAYPNLPYEVRAAVIGGSYPYTFALTTAPAGMTVDKNTGLIKWPTPPASGTAYPVKLTVTDKALVSKQVSWTIKVTTDKFMFVDQANGHNGATGTINDPVKGVIDVYGGSTYDDKYSEKNKDYFVYFKNGTYSLEGFRGEPPLTQGLQMTYRQPLVWMAYPGAAPVIEMSKVAFRLVDTEGDNLYIEGFDIDTINTDAATEFRMGFRIGSLSNNVTFRKNKFHNISPTGGSYNQSAIMISRDAPGKYWSFQDNEFYNLGTAYGILGYTAQKVLIEDNYFHEETGAGGGHPIGPKTSTRQWFIRHNTIKNAKEYAIWVYGNKEDTTPTTSDIEISYNNVSMQPGGFALDINLASLPEGMGPVYVFRNTFKGDITLNTTNTNVGPLTLKKNVFINSMANGYSCLGCLNTSNNFVSDNLVGTAAAGIIDGNGKLTTAYKNYLGNTGWEIFPQTQQQGRSPVPELMLLLQ
ncbi:MAG: putative Ig domain-containing protein, partial [Pseudomonadota bacterium]